MLPNPTVGTVSGLSLASSTSPGAGILFGSDVNLYRSSSSTLATSDAFRADGLGSEGGISTEDSALIGGSVVAGVNVAATGEVRADEDVVAGGYIQTTACGPAPAPPAGSSSREPEPG